MYTYRKLFKHTEWSYLSYMCHVYNVDVSMITLMCMHVNINHRLQSRLTSFIKKDFRLFN